MRSHNPTGSGLTKLWHACRLSIHRTLPTRTQVIKKHIEGQKRNITYRSSRDYTVLSREVPEPPLCR